MSQQHQGNSQRPLPSLHLWGRQQKEVLGTDPQQHGRGMCEGTFLPPTQQNGSGLFVFPDANNHGARLVVASIASFPNVNYRVLKRGLLIVFIYVEGWDFKLFSTAL